jgi:hypothetical protein
MEGQRDKEMDQRGNNVKEKRKRKNKKHRNA